MDNLKNTQNNSKFTKAHYAESYDKAQDSKNNAQDARDAQDARNAQDSRNAEDCRNAQDSRNSTQNSRNESQR